MSMTMCVHRDRFPHTDHGYTWVEFVWFERDGKVVSPLIPAAGCCERLGSMPGGPVLCDLAREQAAYAPEHNCSPLIRPSVSQSGCGQPTSGWPM